MNNLLNGKKLPDGWAIASTDDVCEILAGGPAPQGEEFFSGGNLPFVRVQDMGRLGDNIYLRHTADLINHQAACKLKLFPKGSVLFTKSGASTLNNQRAVLGQDSYVVSHIGVLIPCNNISNLWIYFWLKGVDFKKLAHSTVMPSLPLSKINSLNVLVPPINEQHRIVAKMEALFSELDKGIECFKTAREQLKIYRQALLKHAFSGKLTEQWRAENQDKLETAESLLQHIQTEREQHYQQQLKDWEATGNQGSKPKVPKTLPQLTAEELAELPELPQSWDWVKLSAISTSIQIGPFGSLLHKEDYVSNAIPLVNPSHIKNLKIVPDWNLTVNEQKLKKLSNYILKANDIIIGRRGEMGRCAVIRNSESGWLCGTGSLFVRLLP